MKVFIIQRVEHLTTSYHSEGGLAIVANDYDHARELFAKYALSETKWDNGLCITETEWQTAKVYELAQDAEPAVFIFPDAGRC